MNKDHVVLRHDFDNHSTHLVDGPMTENEAHRRVADLLMGPGIVAYAEDVQAVILPEDGSDVVHSSHGLW